MAEYSLTCRGFIVQSQLGTEESKPSKMKPTASKPDPRYHIQALTLRFSLVCLRTNPIDTKLVPDENVLVLINKSYIHCQNLWFSCLSEDKSP